MPIGRGRHLTKKVETTIKIEIDVQKNYRTNETKVEPSASSSNRIYSEATFKNSIRNKYKMKNLEKNNK